LTYRSLLIVRVLAGQRAAAADAFLTRGVLRECSEVIPQFIAGELRQSITDPDCLCVIADWSDPQGWHDWSAHPLRTAQMADLGAFVVAVEHSDIYAAPLT